jgi:2-keto-3-deoxy-L-rhamnonate aldolase RhmA
MATKRGWSDAGLRTVGDDPELWTVADAAGLLGPPELSTAQVRQLVQLAHIPPVGRRKAARTGRYARVFRAADLIQAYESLYRLQTQTAAP